MTIVMLGWEYPPHIAGGLGIACQGLSEALAGQGFDIKFIVPQLHGGERAPHMNLADSTKLTEGHLIDDNAKIKRVIIPALLQPYWCEKDFEDFIANQTEYLPSTPNFGNEFKLVDLYFRELQERQYQVSAKSHRIQHYGRNIFDEIGRYTENIMSTFANESFDVIHAHDWMTFPAGVALAKATKKPLIAHVHSVEYDRRGIDIDQRIFGLEQFGLKAADSIVAVSGYTKSIIEREYKIDPSKINVVHNGLLNRTRKSDRYQAKIRSSRIVLYLGRITYQKGPGYFVDAAAKVIPHVPDALFVMAGDGDMLGEMKRKVKTLGIGDHFHFPGFLDGEEVEEILSNSLLYVMPSVSEPFGISALEAINFDVPVIISNQSGVSEILEHALKCDFWDVDRLADQIVNALIHEELRENLIALAKENMKNVTWSAAAKKTGVIYKSCADKIERRRNKKKIIKLTKNQTPSPSSKRVTDE